MSLLSVGSRERVDLVNDDPYCSTIDDTYMYSWTHAGTLDDVLPQHPVFDTKSLSYSYCWRKATESGNTKMLPSHCRSAFCESLYLSFRWVGGLRFDVADPYAHYYFPSGLFSCTSRKVNQLLNRAAISMYA